MSKASALFPLLQVSVSRRWVTPVTIATAVILAYVNVYNAPFIYDDIAAIVSNPTIRTLWPITVPMFPPAEYQTAGRPLVGLSFAINYAFDGLNPRGYHLGNIVLHLFSSLILLGVLRRTLRRVKHPQADGIAWATALLWSVHPLLTDTVTYCADRSEVLMGVFWLMTFYAFLRSLESTHPGRWQTGVVASAVAATASKEVATMIPLVLLFFDVLVVTKSWKQTLVRRWPMYAALLLCFVPLPILLAVGSFQKKTVIEQQHISPWQYLLMQSQVITRYIQLCFWPSPLVLSYVDWPIPRSIIQAWPWMAGMGALFAAAVYAVVRKSSLGMMGAWFFLLLGPTSSILVIITEPAAERRMYLPSAAVLLAACLLAARGIRNLPRGSLVGGFVVAVSALWLMQMTLERNQDYSSTLSIWADTATKRPNNPVAHYSLGLELEAQGYLEDARTRLEKAIELAPSYVDARVAYGQVLVHLHRYAEASREIRNVLALHPTHANALTVLGAIYLNQHNIPAAKSALEFALKSEPGHAEATRLLAIANQPATNP